MAIELRWVGEDELDRVVNARMLSYAPSTSAAQLKKYQDDIDCKARAKAGDYLLAELNGTPVGTATALDFQMWVRGGRIPCQGVAYVGTIKTHRRGAGGEKGIASKIMNETLRMARERAQVVSALMPFRASFYEHFGYGIVERRTEWTLPLTTLPAANVTGFRFYRESDVPAMAHCRQRIAQAGQCDIERADTVWPYYFSYYGDGLVVIDRPDDAGPVHSWMHLVHQQSDGLDRVVIKEHGHDSPQALLRKLNFLSTLCDQYSAALITLHSDVPLNWLLKERQLPHRLVNHPSASARPFTRMQLRILDHRRFLEALHLPPQIRGSMTVAIAESEGHATRMKIEISDGHVTAAPTDSSPTFECWDRVWAAIATGDLSASRALQYALAAGDPDSAKLLDAFSLGPAPYCLEYF